MRKQNKINSIEILKQNNKVKRGGSAFSNIGYLL